ncbi:hypothetical protein SAMN04488499_1003114 [Sporomusa acidovorans]|nr:hypothetical protein SPACI_30260 [Sporomusa acidovorans DSM 3132]SDD69772.1 hypothetical protein SAMN04488499_1003114 [Sporomusa acidovorans]
MQSIIIEVNKVFRRTLNDGTVIKERVIWVDEGNNIAFLYNIAANTGFPIVMSLIFIMRKNVVRWLQLKQRSIDLMQSMYISICGVTGKEVKIGMLSYLTMRIVEERERTRNLERKREDVQETFRLYLAKEKILLLKIWLNLNGL